MAIDIAIPIFDKLTALDAIGPYEVLSRLPDATVSFIAKEPGSKRTENGMLALVADRSLADLPEPDVIVVPGGSGTRVLTDDEEVLAWLRHAHEHSTWTTSVCTGSLLLAAAGLLNGLQATTHWLQYDLLRPYGVTPVAERIVRQGKIITAAGVSSGIDMALMLAGEIAGPEWAHGIQLGIEYDPEPPFAGGSPDTAPAAIVELVRAHADRLA
ncbi:MAG TPA: DJ-1/PfpI family protein [Solirubrobacteraceae bacterium]|nr:DJ-1/PfpI family protein [Solirubrobacteraceae bacterium]